MYFKKALIFLFFSLLSQTIYSQTMKAHFIDLGQADATLLEFTCGVVLVDAGGQVQEHKKSSAKLVSYLDDFFERRTDLNNTINTVLITHNHDDHTESLNELADAYTIKNIVSTKLSVRNDVTDVISKEDAIKHRYLTYEDAKNKIPNGLSYNEIDPLACSDVDPIIKVFTGESDIKTTRSINGKKYYKSHFKNPNNNSLVITIRYGKASFMFTGDLEEKGIEYLLDMYKDNLDVFDVDVYQVGHHGSHNATTTDLLNAMSPKISVISAGHTMDRNKPGSAWDHGHPNIDVVKKLMAVATTKERKPYIVGSVFDGQETEPLRLKIENEVYCTCWDHSLVIEADSETGNYRVMKNQ